MPMTIFPPYGKEFHKELNQTKNTIDTQQWTINGLQNQVKGFREQNLALIFLAEERRKQIVELTQENESLRDELEEGLSDKKRLQILLNQKQVLQNRLLQANEKVGNLTVE
jgi:predicted RNase H-like nuclease (RuvC/YqgF family)